MTNIKDDIQVIAQELKTQRDMLSLKVHLAKADVLDEWEVLEKKWHRFYTKITHVKEELDAARVKDEVDNAVENIEDDLHDLSEDLREGYSRIKQSLR